MKYHFAKSHDISLLNVQLTSGQAEELLSSSQQLKISNFPQGGWLDRDRESFAFPWREIALKPKSLIR